MIIELVESPLAHADELLELRIAWAAEQGREITPEDRFARDFRGWLDRESAHRRFWIARLDDVAIAMVNLLVFARMPTVGQPAGGWGYLGNMYVRESRRNDGVGAELASAVLEYADGTGLERVVLSPSERSRPFYAALGFAPATNLLLRHRPAS